MNIPTTENPNQANKQKQSAEQTTLLNAIKNKFASNETNLGTNSPVFSIPSLKCSQLTTLDNNKGTPPLKLNQFILSQLEGKKLSGDTNSGFFSIPELKIKNNNDSKLLTLTDKLRLNNITSPNPGECNINFLNNDISKLHLSDKEKPHVIDLTTALNQSTSLPLPLSSTIITNPIDFHIPFIDCDLEEQTLNLPVQDVHCVADVSGFVHKRYISEPSRFGKITCLKFRRTKVSTKVDHSFAKRHKIARFHFDTKSPDDIVLASLRRNSRV